LHLPSHTGDTGISPAAMEQAGKLFPPFSLKNF
jgi:hypothetical protein